MIVKVIFKNGIIHTIECENMVRNKFDDTLQFYKEGELIGLVNTCYLCAWFIVSITDEGEDNHE